MFLSNPATLHGLRWLSLLLAAMASASLAWLASSVPPLSPPRLGVRGRKRALVRNDRLFRLLEPVLLRLGSFVQGVPLPTLRAQLEARLRHAAHPWGLEADALLALCLVSGAAFASVGSCLAGHVDGGGLSLWAAAGALFPVARLHGLAVYRAEQLERSLPSAMDLCALCMGAGADFPQALELCVKEMGAAHDVCREELARVLDELSLGRTRVEALSALATRSQSSAVQELVAALCQSETKGTPLVDALTIQASTLRQRRSVVAEERAARAAVALMLPLLLMMGAIFLLILGPMFVNGTGL